jgi:hypothetical protein
LDQAHFLGRPTQVFFAAAVALAAFGRLTHRRNPGAVCFLVCTVLGFGASASSGWFVRDLPPNYQDEYAYLFQALTFVDGRASYPASDMAPVFDQVHVLNRGVYVSRYFPGTGLWFTPFVKSGAPVVGAWTCAGLLAGFTALAARRLSPQAGYLAGVLVATAPGAIVFGNSILSHGPTMLAMAVFYWSYPAVFERRQVRWAAIAGFAIGFAFLCRPLTAVGLGFPYAAYSLYRWSKHPPRGYGLRLTVLIASFSMCALGLAWFNYSVLGTPFDTPTDEVYRP